MDGIADRLAAWSYELVPSADDLALADRALVDTVAVTLAARRHPLTAQVDVFGEAGAWATLAHALDFDDLHSGSTTHVSAVCVPATLHAGGGAAGYLRAAGVMARLGEHLGWDHYTRGWHATCTAGAIAAAVAAGVAKDTDPDALATAIALAVPASGGVQRAFGTDAKPLQVGMAVDAGVRAAALAARGASADPTAVDQWAELVTGRAEPIKTEPAPAVPGGLAVKLFPCCYALQRPIHAVRSLAPIRAEDVQHIRVRTSTASVTPLIHHAPTTGAQGKFSLEYGVAAALLDGRPGLRSFTDDAVRRPDARRLMDMIEVQRVDEGTGLLDGDIRLTVTVDGEDRYAQLADIPGSPTCPPADQELAEKLHDCLGDDAIDAGGLDWSTAAASLRRLL
ncbi:MAG: MmgE/PrpD family protein [Streptosporangiales bacterium]|nr:MmgE/PrpD family protein [Streptosporangiales bacterium]MBO0891116.1 MmgE/PrpD family protein [Acidothermales bacterium]